MLKEANETLDSTKMLKKEMWRKRKMAVMYNRKTKEHCF